MSSFLATADCRPSDPYRVAATRRGWIEVQRGIGTGLPD
jgi:hypothetical protein